MTITFTQDIMSLAGMAEMKRFFYKRDFWVTIPQNLLTKRQKYAIDSPLKLKQRNVMYSFSYYLFKAAFLGADFPYKPIIF